MPQHHHAHGHVCPDCDGFPVVHIATGTRTPNGQRRTLRVNCPACKGTGTTPARRRVPALAGR